MISITLCYINRIHKNLSIECSLWLHTNEKNIQIILKYQATNITVPTLK